MKRHSRTISATLSGVGLVLLLALSAGGCNSYSYVDLDLQTGAGFSIVTIGDVSNCHVFVTGATTDDFTLSTAVCHSIDTATGEIAKIQYSTFADSGSVTFTLKLFQGGQEVDGCLIGNVAATIPIESGKTTPLTVLKAPYNPPSNCP
jgi:hypothetical protein